MQPVHRPAGRRPSGAARCLHCGWRTFGGGRSHSSWPLQRSPTPPRAGMARPASPLPLSPQQNFFLLNLHPNGSIGWPDSLAAKNRGGSRCSDWWAYDGRPAFAGEVEAADGGGWEGSVLGRGDGLPSGQAAHTAVAAGWQGCLLAGAWVQQAFQGWHQPAEWRRLTRAAVGRVSWRQAPALTGEAASATQATAACLLLARSLSFSCSRCSTPRSFPPWSASTQAGCRGVAAPPRRGTA